MRHPITLTVRPLSVFTDSRGIRSVTVHCPYCAKRHRHGWPPADPEPGHRLAACVSGAGLGYTITAPEARQ